MHVLCVDDDRVNSLLLENALGQVDGLTLEFAETGAEALSVVRARAPDVLVLDLHLPDADGIALLRELRHAASAPGLPAFLCTAEHEQDVAVRARAAGFRQTWSKPVTIAQVRAALQDLSEGPGPER